MEKLSAVIITKNEAHNIKKCLESVKWVDEIVIIDSGSSDNTLSICQEYKCKIIESDWLGFGKTKQLAVDNAVNEWVFSIDADEEVSASLQQKIVSILENHEFYGYKIKRNSFYLHRLIKHSGWKTDMPLRLFNKNYGRFNDKMVHESVQLTENKLPGKIEEVLYHYTYPTISSHLQKIDKYSSLGAEQDFNSGEKSSIVKSIIKAKAKFFKMYFLKKGFLDGKEGFVLAIISAFGVLIKYLKLWQMQKNN